MEQKLAQIRDEQRESCDIFSPGWKKWDGLMMEFLKPMGDEIISLLNPKVSDIVLDVASGTGEPGHTMATMLINGKVVITDLSENMLEVSRENATQRGIKNIETHACDVCELPFEENTFDLISCRFGYMFFPDMQLATKEMVRVLKPGGKIATSVWNVPEKNFWVTAIGGTINRNMELPLPMPEAPGMFRCSKSGLIQNYFKQSGLKNTLEKEVTGKLKCGTKDVYWTMMTELAAPFVSALSKADATTKETIKREVYQMVDEKYPDGDVIIDSSALIIYGEK
jgi:ubiquinone/menaquinone biosynthesis C-methylase UbiE